MNKRELATIFSAGITIINEGCAINGPVTPQNEFDYEIFETLMKFHFGDMLTSDVIENEMDDREIIRNLVQFGADAKKQALDFMTELNRRISISESKSVCDEFIRVVIEKKLDPLTCPILDSHVAIENITDQYK